MTQPSRESSDKKLRPPRNYTSRREQLRLFMFVGGLFMVIIVFQQARQPEKWRWLTGEKSVADDADVDTRVRTVDHGDRGDLPGTVTAESFHFRPDTTLDDEARAQRRAEKDLWKQQLAALGWSQRREVARVLKGVRENLPLSAEQLVAWQLIIGVLDENWTTNIAEARKIVEIETRLSDADKATWLLILHELEKQWAGGLREALVAAADPPRLSEPQRTALQRFAQLYDELALEEILDDTVDARPNDTAAWFRLLETLNNSSPEKLAELDETAAPRVGFRQLYQQPQDYRGRLVRVSGTAHLAYRVTAPKNIVGIEYYYIFYVQPIGGPNSPLVVYTWELPPGFPPVTELTDDQRANKLNEAVEFVGYFFKRMAYNAQDGTRVAPLLLAKAPLWTPREVREQAELPDWRTALAVALGLAAISVGIAALVYYIHRSSHKEDRLLSPEATTAQFAALAKEPVLPSPSEALAKLAARGNRSTDPGDPL